MSTVLTTGDATQSPTRAPARVLRVSSHIVEVVSDPGEGAQKCGQLFGIVSAKMGNGVWTVEIIPAEIQPPPRDPAGASGNRIRIGSGPVTNWGDATDVVIAFNEQVLLGRHRLGALAPEAVVLLENRWATHADERIRNEWLAAREEMSDAAYRIIEMPMEAECLQIVDDASKGRNMFALGVLACIYQRGLQMFVRTLRRIKPGEEITYHYGMDYLRNVIGISNCRCGRCRRRKARKQREARARMKRLEARTRKKRADMRASKRRARR